MAQTREFGPVVAVFDDFSGLKTLIIPILRMGGEPDSDYLQDLQDFQDWENGGRGNGK